MKNIIFALSIFSFLVLLFGCVQIPAPGQQPASGTGQPAPVVVNITQETAVGNATTNVSQNQTQPATIIVNQTTTTQDSGPKTEDQLSSISQKEITYKTKDSWQIYATHYQSITTNPTRAIILVHQLGANRSSFDSLIPVLHNSLPDADILAIDVRGHGKSTNLGKYTKFQFAGDYRAMSNDIKGAKEYLLFFRNLQDNYYVVGASIGASSAINYGVEDSAIHKIVMLSPGMNYKGVDITNSLSGYRKYLFVVAASEDVQSAADAQTIYSNSDAAFKKILIYEDIGAAHGTDMLNASKNSTDGDLAEVIADWLK